MIEENKLRASLKFVQEHLGNNPLIRGVEVGVAGGHNAKCMLEIMPNLMLDLVEINQNRGDDILGRVGKFGGRVTIYLEDSIKCASGKPDDYYDFVYIDADHSYEAVKKDIAAWYPKIKAGGVLCGHDFDINGVSQAVLEFVGHNTSPLHTSPNAPIDWWIVK